MFIVNDPFIALGYTGRVARPLHGVEVMFSWLGFMSIAWSSCVSVYR